MFIDVFGLVLDTSIFSARRMLERAIAEGQEITPAMALNWSDPCR